MPKSWFEEPVRGDMVSAGAMLPDILREAASFIPEPAQKKLLASIAR